MESLRWILLLAGLVFLAGLAAWESRRPRQASGDADNRPERPGRSPPELGEAHSHGHAPLAASRPELPPLDPIITAADIQGADDEAEPAEIELPEPISALGPMSARDTSHSELPSEMRAERLQRVPTLDPDEVPESDLLSGAPRSPVVEWPPESERRILALRIAALSHERLSGRVVRQALGACGFEHGRFGIFHQPGADGRALLSAANLSKPGIFDPLNMDFQRFSGLSLFAVLPGPLPPAAALDHLLDTAQDLAERLRARLQDEQGLALGAPQLDALRQTVQDLTDAGARAEPAA
ncbi:MAG TPA: cell division protein ZipA C-terminal FtsZ-binding domain-containing protein [Steroidobacteraceae bacterium]|jgi:FtsZ-interacting cell division protein ZipA